MEAMKLDEDSLWWRMGLADYKGIIGATASTFSFSLLLAPAFLCLKIWKNGSSRGIPFSPLMEGMARSSLLFQQGLVMGIRTLIITHTIGLLFNLSYVTIYIMFTKDKSEVKKSILRWSALLIPMIVYAHYEDKSLVERRFGTLMSTFTICLMLYHLYKVRHVIATKNTKDLPFPILVAAAIVTFLWTLYGFAIDKPSLQLQAGFGFCVCVFELSLFAIFPSKPTEPKKKD